MGNIFDGWSDIDIGDPSSWPITFKIFGAIVIAIGIIGATYYLKVTKQRLVLEAAVQEEGKLKEEFKEKKELAINLDAYKAQMIEAENMFAELKEQLPSETEIPDLLVDVTQLGLSRGLIFEEFEPRNEINKDFYKEKPVKIIVSGKYHEMAHFMSDIAALSRIVNVQDFTITRRNKNSIKSKDKSEIEKSLQESPLKMSASIKTYYYEEEE